jgi:hypothetical protein
MSSKIKILDAALSELATIAVASSAVRTERINSDNTLNFSIRVKSGYGAYINDTSVFELDGDYFDIAYYKAEQQADGTLMIAVESEHVSYRLNDADYNVEYFTETGTPTQILTAILDGTGFTVGTVDFATSMTFSLQQAASRRGLLMLFAAYVGGELEFDGFTISLLAQRGSSTPTALTVGKDITVVSKAVNKRQLDDAGNPTVSYTCGVYKAATLNLGDVVTINYDALGIAASLRVVTKAYDPYNPNNVTVEIGNFVSGLEDDLYRIETQSVKKDALMNGCRIGPEYGFEAVRNDNLARAYFRADGMAMQSGDGSGNWTDRLKYEYDSDAGETTLVFNGKLSATIIEALSALISPSVYAQKATIAEITVDELDTSDKVNNYLNSDVSDDNFQRIYDQFHEFITAAVTDEGAGHVQATDRDGNLLYWLDANHEAASTTETAYPVYTYNYSETAKLKLGFQTEPESGQYMPMIELGAGIGDGNKGKGFIYKGVSGLYLDYYNNNGELRRILLGTDGIVITPYELKQLGFYDNGFTATYDAETVSMTWTKDGDGKITALTTEDNVTIPVNWHAGDM